LLAVCPFTIFGRTLIRNSWECQAKMIGLIFRLYIAPL
jgi:hypothetical protein